MDTLHDAGLLDDEKFRVLREAYDFLRTVESRLRIVHNLSLDELPENPDDLEKLARRLGFDGDDVQNAATQFLSELERHTTQTRELFLALVARERDRLVAAPDTPGLSSTSA